MKMAFNVMFSMGLLLLLTSVKLEHANPGLEELEDLNDYHNFTKRNGCNFGTIMVYTVMVRTCDRLWAGTDGEVKIGFVGPDPNCKAPANYATLYTLDKPNYDDFERNQMNWFDVYLPSVSPYNELAGFRISHSSNSDKWCFDYITIRNTYLKDGTWRIHNYRKNYNDWIGRGYRDLDLVEQL